MPVKYEHVVFCRPSSLQVSLYTFFTNSKEIQVLLRGSGSQPLKAIDLLRKLCNTPQLLSLPNALRGCEYLLPPEYVGMGNDTNTKPAGRIRPLSAPPANAQIFAAYSGKMAVLERLVKTHIVSSSCHKGRSGFCIAYSHKPRRRWSSSATLPKLLTFLRSYVVAKGTRLPKFVVLLSMIALLIFSKIWLLSSWWSYGDIEARQDRGSIQWPRKSGVCLPSK